MTKEKIFELSRKWITETCGINAANTSDGKLLYRVWTMYGFYGSAIVRKWRCPFLTEDGQLAHYFIKAMRETPLEYNNPIYVA
jgi:hypothetical protein